MEQNITTDQARAIITEHGGYGKVRVYGTLPTGETLPIKSEYHLTRFEYTRIYSKGNDGTVPIRKA